MAKQDDGTREESWRPLLRQHGLRVTPARVLVLDALQVMGHGTPEQIYEQMAPDLPGLNVSTVYRTLEILAEYEIVTHAHLDQPSATYMLATHADHAHLVCRGCHEVFELDQAVAKNLQSRVSRIHRFDIDTGHLSIFGRCESCSGDDNLH